MSNTIAEFEGYCDGRIIIHESSSREGNHPIWIRYKDISNNEKAAIHLNDDEQKILLAVLEKIQNREDND